MFGNDLEVAHRRILRADEVARRLGGVHRTTLWRWVQEGRLPAPTRYGRGVTGWLEEDINNWIAKAFNTEETEK